MFQLVSNIFEFSGNVPLKVLLFESPHDQKIKRSNDCVGKNKSLKVTILPSLIVTLPLEVKMYKSFQLFSKIFDISGNVPFRNFAL